MISSTITTYKKVNYIDEGGLIVKKHLQTSSRGHVYGIGMTAKERALATCTSLLVLSQQNQTSHGLENGSWLEANVGYLSSSDKSCTSQDEDAGEYLQAYTASSIL